MKKSFDEVRPVGESVVDANARIIAEIAQTEAESRMIADCAAAFLKAVAEASETYDVDLYELLYFVASGLESIADGIKPAPQLK